MYTEFLLKKEASYGGVSLSKLQPGHREHDLGDEMGQTMNQERQVKGGSKVANKEHDADHVKDTVEAIQVDALGSGKCST